MSSNEETKGVNLKVPEELYDEVSDYARAETRKEKSKITIHDTVIACIEIGIKQLKHEALINKKNR